MDWSSGSLPASPAITLAKCGHAPGVHIICTGRQFIETTMKDLIILSSLTARFLWNSTSQYDWIWAHESSTWSMPYCCSVSESGRHLDAGLIHSLILEGKPLGCSSSGSPAGPFCSYSPLCLRMPQGSIFRLILFSSHSFFSQPPAFYDFKRHLFLNKFY